MAQRWWPRRHAPLAEATLTHARMKLLGTQHGYRQRLVPCLGRQVSNGIGGKEDVCIYLADWPLLADSVPEDGQLLARSRHSKSSGWYLRCQLDLLHRDLSFRVSHAFDSSLVLCLELPVYRGSCGSLHNSVGNLLYKQPLPHECMTKEEQYEPGAVGVSKPKDREL